MNPQKNRIHSEGQMKPSQCTWEYDPTVPDTGSFGGGPVEDKCGKLLGDHCVSVALVKLKPEPTEWQPRPPVEPQRLGHRTSELEHLSEMRVY